MSPILCLIATCLLGGIAAQSETGAEPVPAADPVIGWARVEFDANGIVESAAGGLADLDTERELTVDDPVRIASISKLVVALAAARLVEEGAIDLRDDVSIHLGWRLRNPHFPDEVITLRALLDHRAGVRDTAGYALPLDADLEAWTGQPEAWDAEHPPGWFAYANLNFPIIAAVLEGATGERFDRLMARTVFEPLGLDACFNWTTCSDEARSRAVALYRPDGEVARDSQRAIAEDCPATPARDGSCDLDTYRLARNGAAFSPQGGLRISASDLARIGMLFLSRGEGTEFAFVGRHYRRLPLIPMLYSGGRAPITANGESAGGFFCRYNHGVHTLNGDGGECDDDLFATGAVYSGHSGEAYGLRSGLWISHEERRGVAYFATGLPETPRPGRSAFSAVEERLAQDLPLETYRPPADD
ncbi:serine hydrolase [Parasphingopyxis algicola]|uniref:serine hydrolase domain-containing protein n=1 Tax=Parasphingopyxis algicola TaxID=2026624 RepID=UPI0015A45E1E|nr:serine hydrolase domain-containing protein [Parasphingopyxis algicola]QLC25832.1 serine hydrolase [Parasphingopyxis algicola]